MRNLVILLLLCNHCFAQPIISSFSPGMGPVGSTVTISGANFSSTASSNVVYFGAVKATIINASTTSLDVMVPPGALYKPITVTTGGLTGYSVNPFIVTFNSNSTIDPNSFATKFDSLAGVNPIYITSGDLNSDGKPDIVVANNSSNTISIFKNTSTNDLISFALKQDIAIGNYPSSVSISDIDGDGLLDILVTNTVPAEVAILRNTSSNNAITFAAAVRFSTQTDPDDIGTGDFDGDGKTDLAVVNYNAFSISVLKNTGTIGNIAFADKVNYSTGNLFPWRVALGDIDGDGKTDMVVSDYDAIHDSVSVFRNTSINGIISFDSKVDFPKSRGALGVSISDIDGDNKPDIVAPGWVSNNISILRNNGSPGNISFSTAVDYATGSFPESIYITDMDGDGKPDISVGNYLANSVSLLQNKSHTGIISFAAKKDFTTGANPKSLAVVDLNGDAKPDMVTANLNSNNISVLRNTMTSVALICANTGTTLVSNFTGANYQWQQSTDSVVFYNLSDDTTYSGSASSILSINHPASGWYGYRYRCIIDGLARNLFELQFSNRWTGLADSSWENPANWSCGILPDANTDVAISSGTIILSSLVTVRSLELSVNASFTVTAEGHLTVTH